MKKPKDNKSTKRALSKTKQTNGKIIRRRNSQKTTGQPETKRAPSLAKQLFLIIIATSLVITAFVSWMILTKPERSLPVTDKTDEKHYFSDSKYKGIRSKFVTRSSKKEATSLEYPVTDNNKINKITSSIIDRYDNDFKHLLPGGSGIKPMTQTISYQVSYNTSDYLSIAIYIKQDTHGAHPLSATSFWTFDKNTGAAISLDDLLEGDENDIKALLDAAKKSVKKTLEDRKKPEANLEEYLTKSTLNNFTISNNSITWPFGQQAFLPSSYGEIGINLPAKDLATNLQHPLARKLLNIPEPKKMPPTKPALPQANPSANCPSGRCVALTFDDGPGPHTERLLDILRQHNVKASFFVLGSKSSSGTHILRRTASEGHYIGNHSWSHANLSKLEAGSIHKELSQTSEAIYKATGKRPSSMRPPYGASNHIVASEMKKLEMSSIMWSVDTRDWADRNSIIVCNRAVAGASPGAIILMHDIHSTSVDATPCIIDALKKQGYSFVTVEQLFGKLVPGETYHSNP